MQEEKYLTKRQYEVIDDLFTEKYSEDEILERHGLDRRIYYRWHMTRNFAAEYERRLKRAKREGEMIIIRFAPVAASKLVELTQSKSVETARKACLDVINFKKKSKERNKKEKMTKQLPKLAPEKASRLLDALEEYEKENEAK
jgi:hypothetical protein